MGGMSGAEGTVHSGMQNETADQQQDQKRRVEFFPHDSVILHLCRLSAI